MSFLETISKIAEIGGGSDELLELLNNLKEDYESAKAEEPPEGFSSWSEAYSDVNTKLADEKRRYIERFFSAGKADEKQNEDEEEDKETEELKTYDDLFKKESE